MDNAGIETLDPEVKIIGNNIMQNELLASFLKAETGLYCSQCSVLKLPDVVKESIRQPTLFLLDAQNTDLFILLNSLNTNSSKNGHKCFVAAFNLNEDVEIDKESFIHNLHGIFFKNQPLDLIAKGILDIFRGDYWYLQKTLSKYLSSKRLSMRLKGELSSELTIREIEVLRLIREGACNKEIVENLSISFHTVKTHVFNIFRKRDVNSRFQATLWVKNFLA